MEDKLETKEKMRDLLNELDYKQLCTLRDANHYNMLRELVLEVIRSKSLGKDQYLSLDMEILSDMLNNIDILFDNMKIKGKYQEYNHGR